MYCIENGRHTAIQVYFYISYLGDLCLRFHYRMERRKMGLAVIINNLDQEQTPTKKDVEAMGQVLKTIG